MLAWQRLQVRVRRARPVALVALGYASYIALGFALLRLPWCHAVPVAAVDDLFMAASAVSTTGLVTVSTAGAYTWLGELCLLVLIQLGGLGYMTLGSVAIIARHHELSPLRDSVVRTVFTLPEKFRPRAFIARVAVFSMAIEIAGAAALYPVLRSAGIERPLWSAVFHSISAFCTAGFGLLDDSFESLRGDLYANVVLSVLSLLGAVGFIVIADYARRIAGHGTPVTYTSRVIMRGTWIPLAIIGAILFVAEPTIASLPATERLLASAFQAMTAITTVGFNTVPIGQLAPPSILLLAVAMIIGASPAGTGGGIKSTTAVAAFATTRSLLLGRRRPTFLGQVIPPMRVWTAFAAIALYLFLLATGSFLLLLVEAHPFEAVVFEAASALGTVGLSMGITSALTPLGKLLVVALMFAGRLGPLVLALAVLGDERGARDERGVSDLAV